MPNFRIEKDMLGEYQIPENAYYGVHTARALDNFKINYKLMNKRLIKSFAQVKHAAALANFKSGKLTQDKLDAIVFACGVVGKGKYNSQFKLPGLQGGAGTSTNMNANEVIANVALEHIGYKKGEYKHLCPLEDVNMSQSTNDSYPTAFKIAIYALIRETEKSIKHLRDTLDHKASEFKEIYKMGRTQLEDAVPLTLGEEFKAYARAINRDLNRLRDVKKDFLVVNMGGTAIGTGVGTTEIYRKEVIKELADITGFDIVANVDLIDGTQNLDDYAHLSGILRTLALNLRKIANDLRLMNSGPNTGVHEIDLPPLQAGSSIMPKKVNPVGAEFIMQIHLKVKGNDLVIAESCSNGEFELNANEPIVADCLLESLEILNDGCRNFADKVIKDIKAVQENCDKYMQNCPTAATVLINDLGYEKVSEIISEVIKTGKNYKVIAVERGYLPASYFEKQ
ncbi:MAG: aspartate ammonia-lyase [Fusobacteria bacterium]|nr:aspartate ammonia-lyase [Fusobacteriota bacterium]